MRIEGGFIDTILFHAPLSAIYQVCAAAFTSRCSRKLKCLIKISLYYHIIHAMQAILSRWRAMPIKIAPLLVSLVNGRHDDTLSIDGHYARLRWADKKRQRDDAVYFRAKFTSRRRPRATPRAATKKKSFRQESSLQICALASSPALLPLLGTHFRRLYCGMTRLPRGDMTKLMMAPKVPRLERQRRRIFR